MHPLLRLIRFASGDYARKYLVGEPILARKGDVGYDPNVEREVKAALTHTKPTGRVSDKSIRRHYRKLAKHSILKSGYAPMEVVAGGEGGKKRFMPLVKIVHPYRKIKSQIAQQQRSLTEKPKAPPAPPPEMLSKHGGKTPARGGSYEGVVLPDNLWDREAAKPGKIKYIYPHRQSVHDRPPLTKEQVSILARKQRDPIATHEAKVKAGITESAIVKREDKITGLPNTYLPKPIDIEERRSAQAIRDHLARKLTLLRKETIQPMRAARNKALGKAPVKPMPIRQISAIRKSSEGLVDREIAPGKPFQKPVIKPTVPIPGGEVQPAVINRYHRVLNIKVANAKAGHIKKANDIRNDIHNRLKEQFSKLEHPQHGALLRDTASRLVDSSFNPNRTSIEGELAKVPKGLRGKPGMEDWEVNSLAEHTGTSPDWIRKQHKTYVKHTMLGTSDFGERKIRRALNLKRFTNIPGAAEETKKAAYPILKSIGRRTAVGASLVAGVAGGAYVAKKLWGRKKPRELSDRMKLIQFRVPGVRTMSAVTSVQRKLKDWSVSDIGKRRLKLGGALTGGIAAADAVTSAAYPDPDKSRTKSAYSGLKRGTLYGGTLAATEPLIWKHLKNLHSKLRLIRFQQKKSDDSTLTHDITVGGIEGGAGVLATDRLIRKLAPESGPGKVAIGAAVGGLATGTIGTALNRLIRRHKQQKQQNFEIAFKVARSGLGVLENGEKIDIKALNRLVQDRVANRIKIKTLKPMPYTKASGYSERRVTKADISKPILRYGREVLDGRHRITKKQRLGHTSVSAIKVTKKDLDAVKMSAINFAQPVTRVAVAQDRYKKQIHERERQRMESNLSRSAVAGGVLAAALRKKASLGKSLAVGAVAGLGTEGALIAHNSKNKDTFGDRTYGAKRVEKLPYQAAGLAAAGIAGRSIYNKLHKLSSHGKLIKFDQFIPNDRQSAPWHTRELARWINHPKSRVENAQKWLGRAGRAWKDIGLPKNKLGKVIDERGRERTPEWKKDWFKRSVGGGLAVGAILGGVLIKKNITKSARSAAGLLEKGIHPSELSQGERMSLNVTSGNLGRAIKSKLQKKFPKFTGKIKAVSGLRGELHQAKENILSKANKSIEGETGSITSAKLKRDKHNQITGIDIDNPAVAKENLDKIHTEQDKLSGRLEQLRRQRERIKGTQGTRGKLEQITKLPTELSSKARTIQFDDVYVRPHTRSSRRKKYKHEKKDFREGFLIGGGVGLGGLGLGSGIAYKAHSQKITEETEARVMERLGQIAAKSHIARKTSEAVLRPLKHLSAKLDKIINFKANENQ